MSRMSVNPGSRKLVVAIDGVVGAGKSATARGAARALGYRHLDTGSMYRALTLAALARGIDADEIESLATCWMKWSSIWNWRAVFAESTSTART